MPRGFPAFFAGVADGLPADLPPERAMSSEQVADLFRFLLSGTERLAALSSPSQSALRGFLLRAHVVRSEAATQPLERADTAEPRVSGSEVQPPSLQPLKEGDPAPPLPLPPLHLSPLHALGAVGGVVSLGLAGCASRGAAVCPGLGLL
ncbi:hypothetical protein ACSSS7_004965 [Eimeria intestinalis]